MTVWIIMTVLAATAAVISAAPFLRRIDGAREAGRIDVYRDQLAEVERERKDGLIDEAEADMARVEIERRILTVSKTDGASAQGIPPVWRQRSVVAVSAIVVLGSVGLYAANGSPELPGVPFVQRATATAATQKTAPAQVAANQTGGQQHDIATMIKGLAAKLKADPNNLEGWRMLGWSYYNTNQFKEAAQAYARAIELKKDDAQLKSAYGEALVRANDGVVTAEARDAFSATLKLKPEDARARFFIGLEKQQNGDPKAAITDWVDMLKTAPAGAQWAGDLRAPHPRSRQADRRRCRPHAGRARTAGNGAATQSAQRAQCGRRQERRGNEPEGPHGDDPRHGRRACREA